MQKPGPIRKDQLKHPADKRSAFNGDPWRGEKKKNFTSTVSTTSGSRPPTNIHEVPIAHINPDGSVSHGKDITGAIGLSLLTTSSRPIQGLLIGNQR